MFVTACAPPNSDQVDTWQVQPNSAAPPTSGGPAHLGRPRPPRAAPPTSGGQSTCWYTRTGKAGHHCSERKDGVDGVLAQAWLAWDAARGDRGHAATRMLARFKTIGRDRPRGVKEHYRFTPDGQLYRRVSLAATQRTRDPVTPRPHPSGDREADRGVRKRLAGQRHPGG